MANIRDLTEATTVSGSDLLPIYQGGSGRTRSVSYSVIKTDVTETVSAEVAVAVAAAEAAETAAASADATVLRSELADGVTAGDGADLVEYASGVSVRDKLDSLDTFDTDLQDTTDPAKGAAIVGRGVIAIDSVAALLAIPLASREEDKLYSVESYHAGWAVESTFIGPRGGGLFSYSTALAAQNNGGTIFDGFVRIPDGSIGLRPEWFGAKGDAVISGGALTEGTDDYAAFQLAVDLIESSQGDGFSNGLSCIQLSERGYLIGTVIECIGNLRILGSANPKHVSRGPQAFITGSALLPQIFQLRGFEVGGRPAGSAGAQYGFELDHVGFKSYTGGPLCAVQSVAVGAPARPFNVLSCQFLGFEQALFFDLIDDLGTSTGVYNLNVTGSVFFGGNYAIRARGPNALGGLVFKGNVSEQGGRILVETGGGFGTFDISDNLLEGQDNTIEINMGRGVVHIGPNYWEANTGVDIKVTSTTVRRTTLRIDKQYTRTFPLTVECGAVTMDAPPETGVIDTLNNFWLASGLGHLEKCGDFDGFFARSTPSQKFRGTVGRSIWNTSKKDPFFTGSNSLLTNRPNIAGNFNTDSPVGPMIVQSRTPGQFADSTLGAVPIAAGDIAVYCAWIYADTESGGRVILDYSLLDQDVVTMQAEAGVISLAPGWNAVFIMLEPSTTATGHRWRITNNAASGANIYIGSSFAYVRPRGTDIAPNLLPWGFPKEQFVLI